MRPAFCWGARRPWVEMQISAWNAPTDATAVQLAVKGTMTFMWIGFLLRVLTFIANEYYAIKQVHEWHSTTASAPQATAERALEPTCAPDSMPALEATPALAAAVGPPA